MFSRGLVLLFFAVLPLTAFAQIITPGKVSIEEVKNSSGSEFYVLRLTGTIAYPLALEVRDLIAKMKDLKPLHLHLTSGGGAYSEGMKIIAMLRQEIQKGRRVTTAVHNGELCGSMCVPLFLQGQKRLAGEASIFMFHGMVPHGLTNIPNEATTREALNIFLDAGVNSKWLDLMWSRGAFSKPGQYFISGRELFDENAGIITDLLPRHEVFEPHSAPIDPQIGPHAGGSTPR